MYVSLTLNFFMTNIQQTKIDFILVLKLPSGILLYYCWKPTQSSNIQKDYTVKTFKIFYSIVFVEYK